MDLGFNSDFDSKLEKNFLDSFKDIEDFRKGLNNVIGRFGSVVIFLTSGNK
jgi:hypothetical protein